MSDEHKEYAEVVAGLKAALARAEASIGDRLGDSWSFGSGIKVGHIRKCIEATEELLGTDMPSFAEIRGEP